METIARTSGATLVALALLLAGCGITDGPPWHIPGTAELPQCTEPPAFDLDGAAFSDVGIVTIQSAGCAESQPGQIFASCPLAWVFREVGSDLEIMVDGEYRIEARLCGDQLHLRGGWWLPVEDEGFCTYEEDSAEEVGIMAGGSTLTISEEPLSGSHTAVGVLSLEGPCRATYDVTMSQFM